MTHNFILFHRILKYWEQYCHSSEISKFPLVFKLEKKKWCLLHRITLYNVICLGFVELGPEVTGKDQKIKQILNDQDLVRSVIIMIIIM